ncbi:MAG TPA: hypothetical protein VHO72_02250, partial [Bacteroidales bacterium]|nr:hypothetical protein [Bacteroidales bacterium]
MNKLNFLRSFATIALLVVAGTGAFAQVTGTGSLVAKGAAPEDVDYVTVNSTMPYQVTPFDWGTLAPIMNPSIYKWSIATGASGTDWTMFQSNGTTALADIPANPGYYTQNAISIKWLAPGSYVLNVTEKSQPTVGTSCEETTPQDLTVNILPWPKANWGTNTDPSACGLTGNVTVNLACTGSQSITVSYNVYFTALATGSARTKLNPTLLTVGLTNAGY